MVSRLGGLSRDPADSGFGVLASQLAGKRLVFGILQRMAVAPTGCASGAARANFRSMQLAVWRKCGAFYVESMRLFKASISWCLDIVCVGFWGRKKKQGTFMFECPR